MRPISKLKFQMSDLDLDPQLLSACAVDLKRTCRLDEFDDKTQVLECLRKNELELSPSCKNVSSNLSNLYNFLKENG